MQSDARVTGANNKRVFTLTPERAGIHAVTEIYGEQRHGVASEQPVSTNPGSAS